MKTMPNNQQAEEALLGSMIKSQGAVSSAISKLTESDFYSYRSKLLFNALVAMYGANITINIETVIQYLIDNKLVEEVIGQDVKFLEQLCDAAPIKSNADYYCDIVKTKSLERQLIIATSEISEECFDSTGKNINDIFDEAEKKIFSITQKRTTKDFTSLKETMPIVLQQIEQNKDKKIIGTTSGYHKLDYLTGGFRGGNLIIVAARPGMGKTSFGMNIMENICIGVGKEKNAVGFFSLEMNKVQLAERIIASKSHINLSDIRNGNLRSPDWAKLGQNMQMLYNSPIYMDDSNPLTIMELKGKARKLYARTKEAGQVLKAIEVDYLQLVAASNGKKNGTREQEVAEVSRGLKSLAMELDVPVIAMAQINRGVEGRNKEDRRPRLSDLRESGGIESDSDIVIFLHSDQYYNNNPHEEKNNSDPILEGELIVSKNRSGAVGNIPMLFFKEYTRYEQRVEENNAKEN